MIMKNIYISGRFVAVLVFSAVRGRGVVVVAAAGTEDVVEERQKRSFLREENGADAREDDAWKCEEDADDAG